MNSSRPERPVIQDARGYKRKLGDEEGDVIADGDAFGLQAGDGFGAGMGLDAAELVSLDSCEGHGTRHLILI